MSRIPNLHDAAVELFLARASGDGVTDLGTSLDVIEQICAALDDIPLAIELAAAHVASLPLGELLVRIDDRFALLGGGRRSGRRRQRQQTLQAMMDWSYGLLSGEEQQLLGELSVFAGSFSLLGVEAVATASRTPVLARIQSLVQQSLVVPLRDSGRYRLLETVRLSSLDKLAEIDAICAIRSRHLTWVYESFGPAVYALTSGAEALAFEYRQWAEVENAVAAMRWAEQTGDAEALFGLFIGFGSVWQNDNPIHPRRTFLARTDPNPGNDRTPRTRPMARGLGAHSPPTRVVAEGQQRGLDASQEGRQVVACRCTRDLKVDRPVAVHDAVACPARVCPGDRRVIIFESSGELADRFAQHREVLEERVSAVGGSFDLGCGQLRGELENPPDRVGDLGQQNGITPHTTSEPRQHVVAQHPVDSALGDEIDSTPEDLGEFILQPVDRTAKRTPRCHHIAQIDVTRRGCHRSRHE